MMKFALAILFIATLAYGQLEAAKLIPVRQWPRHITTSKGLTVNPSVAECVRAGYRMIPAKPVTPEGKRIKSEMLVQDDKKTDSVKWAIIYEDIPEPSPLPPPPVITNVPADRVEFRFTEYGAFLSAVWLDAPSTNAVE